MGERLNKSFALSQWRGSNVEDLITRSKLRQKILKVESLFYPVCVSWTGCSRERLKASEIIGALPIEARGCCRGRNKENVGQASLISGIGVSV